MVHKNRKAVVSTLFLNKSPLLLGFFVSLFNGISTLFRLFNAKVILLEELLLFNPQSIALTITPRGHPLSLLRLPCYQFFFKKCRITIHYFLPFCTIYEQDPYPFSHTNNPYG